MPRSKLSAGLTSLIEPDSEPDFDSFEAVGADGYLEETRAMSVPNPARRGRPAANRITKPSQRQAPNKRGGTAARTKALETRALEQEDGDEAVVNSPGKPARGRPKASKPLATAESTQNVTRLKGRRGRPPKARASEGIEGQTPEKHDVSHTNTMEMDDVEDETPGSVKPVSLPETYQPLHMVGDADDDSLQRQLEEMSRKYDSLEARHSELKEAVIKEAERNFDRLKKQAEESKACKLSLLRQRTDMLTLILSCQQANCRAEGGAGYTDQASRTWKEGAIRTRPQRSKPYGA